MSGHTKWPWAARPYPQAVDLPKKSQMIVIETADDDGYIIGFACSWIDNPETAKEAMANAKILAAAPDLLEALEVISRLYDYEATSGENSSRLYDARSIALLAIAKARGEK